MNDIHETCPVCKHDELFYEYNGEAYCDYCGAESDNLGNNEN